MSEQKIIKVWLTLLEEGTDTLRATNAIDLGNNIVELLPTDNYDPEDEIWEFLPHTIVRLKKDKDFRGRDVMVAYEKVERPL